MIRKSSDSRRAQLGAAAEQAALHWLQGQGLQCVARNFRCRCGEIDLIMLDGRELVFVEVRLRSRSDFGGAAASVTLRKQQRLQHAASWFLQANPRFGNAPCRFDVLAASSAAGDEQWQWLRNAFY